MAAEVFEFPSDPRLDSRLYLLSPGQIALFEDYDKDQEDNIVAVRCNQDDLGLTVFRYPKSTESIIDELKLLTDTEPDRAFVVGRVAIEGIFQEEIKNHKNNKTLILARHTFPNARPILVDP